MPSLEPVVKENLSGLFVHDRTQFQGNSKSYHLWLQNVSPYTQSFPIAHGEMQPR